MDILAWITVASVAAFIAWQASIVVRALRMRGRPVPRLGNELAPRIGAFPVAVLYFGTERCHNCRAMRPTVDRLATGYPNLVAIDAVEEHALAQRFGVRATPTTVRVRDGLIDEVLLGRVSEERLRALLEG